MASENFQAASWDEEALWQMYGPSNCTPQPQTLWGNEEALWQMYGPSNCTPQPQTLWGNEDAPQQMYGLSNYPPQPQPLWGNEALRQMPKRLPQLRVAPLTSKDKSFLQSSEDIATGVGWGKFQVAYQQSQVLTQEVAQSTDVDAMMRAIQAKPASDSSSEAAAGKKRARAQDAGSGGENGRGGGVESANAGEYKCYFGECQKAFTQKGQMKIHIRVHTGETPYACTYPSCTRAFSQLGNLKSHFRRHTGERPFACPTCGKTFAQRSNLSTHAAVHNAGGAAKNYVCRLDECGKVCTQLGNLKSHMNKVHAETLRALTARFGERGGGEEGEENELLEYFRRLYRNANKGIKGRGKGRKVRKVASTHNTGSTTTSPPSLSYSLPSLASLPYTGRLPAHLDTGMEMEGGEFAFGVRMYY